jgi:hypothetical protein
MELEDLIKKMVADYGPLLVFDSYDKEKAEFIRIRRRGPTVDSFIPSDIVGEYSCDLFNDGKLKEDQIRRDIRTWIANRPAKV